MKKKKERKKYTYICVENETTIARWRFFKGSKTRPSPPSHYGLVTLLTQLSRDIQRTVPNTVTDDASRVAAAKTRAFAYNAGLLVFTKRTCKSFRCPIALKTLYCSLVRSKLKYCALIWSNNTIGHCSVLEKIQNNFLMCIALKFEIKRPLRGSCTMVLEFSNLKPLIERRNWLFF